jgi:hypothetical protein
MGGIKLIKGCRLKQYLIAAKKDGTKLNSRLNTKASQNKF